MFPSKTLLRQTVRKYIFWFETGGTLKRQGYLLWPRLNSPYIVWIPQVPVLSVEHEDKRNLIRRGAIFNAIRRDLLTSKLVKNIRINSALKLLSMQHSAFLLKTDSLSMKILTNSKFLIISGLQQCVNKHFPSSWRTLLTLRLTGANCKKWQHTASIHLYVYVLSISTQTSEF